MKLKKVISIALSALIMSSCTLPQTNTIWHSKPMTVLADEVIPLGTYDKITYVSYIESAGITKIDSSISGTLTIPAEIKGLAVRGFEPNAFSGCNSITKIILPHSIGYILDDMFTSCSNLKELSIMNPALQIGYGAIPSNITLYGFENSTVQKYAEEFGNEFILLEPVESLANGKCGDNIDWSISSAGILSITGTGKMYDWTYLENSSPFANGHNSFYNAIKVDNGIANIGDRAFSSSQVKNVELPDSIVSIGEESFAYCMDLSNIIIPESVENIENLAFSWCQSLEAITIENPDCVIYDSESTIYEAATIYGYNGSTAQAYAEKYNRDFESLDEEIITTTTTTTTTTTKTTTTTAPVLIGPGDSVSEGDKYTADGGFSEAEIEASIVKPVISASKKVITLEEAKNSQQIDITISGADGKYSDTSMHIYYDPRLDIEMDRLGNPNVKIGEAGENLMSQVMVDPTVADNDCDGLLLMTAGNGNDGKDGVLWSLNVMLPDDAEEGDVYPINIIYCSNATSEDLFINEEQDEQGKLMQAYAWTRGIYSEKYNYNFEADMDDIEKCPALKNIKRNVDGYIAIADGEKITTTTTTTTTTSTTVTTTTSPVTSKPDYSLGDVNNDGMINPYDASIILQEYAAVQTGMELSLNEIEKTAADIDCNNRLDAIDAILILDYYSYRMSGAEPISLEEFVGLSGGVVLEYTGNANNGFTSEEITASAVKPTITLTKSLISNDECKDIQLVDLIVENANAKWSSAGLHLYYDSRLTPAINRNGEIDFTIGAAADYLTRSVVHNESNHSIFFATTSKADYGLDGVLATFKFYIPEDAQPGDVYYFDLKYVEGDVLLNVNNDNESKLMQAYLFTQGIYNKEYNNNFIAEANDIEKCSTLADIDKSYDGYIAIADEEEIITTTSMTTSTTTSTTSTTSTTTTSTTTLTTTTTTTTNTTTEALVTTTTSCIETNSVAIVVNNTTATEGENVSIFIDIENNPGVSNAEFDVAFDSECLEFIDAQSGDAMADTEFSCDISEDGTLHISFTGEGKDNGTMAVLNFNVLKTPEDSKASVTIVDDSAKITDSNGENVGIEVIYNESTESNAGDVNNDGEIDLKDVVLIRRFIAGGWNVELDTETADVNNDNEVDLKDVVLIRRYIAGGWNVELA